MAQDKMVRILGVSQSLEFPSSYYILIADRALHTDCAPSILITFINMMLLSYNPEKWKQPNPVDCGNYTYMYGDTEGHTQVTTLGNQYECSCIIVTYNLESGTNVLRLYRPAIGTCLALRNSTAV